MTSRSGVTSGTVRMFRVRYPVFRSIAWLNRGSGVGVRHDHDRAALGGIPGNPQLG